MHVSLPWFRPCSGKRETHRAWCLYTMIHRSFSHSPMIPWRREPIIAPEPQQELAHWRGIEPDEETGKYPFGGKKLTCASGFIRTFDETKFLVDPVEVISVRLTEKRASKNLQTEPNHPKYV
jgi:hypothetical protein